MRQLYILFLKYKEIICFKCWDFFFNENCSEYFQGSLFLFLWLNWNNYRAAENFLVGIKLLCGVEGGQFLNLGLSDSTFHFTFISTQVWSTLDLTLLVLKKYGYLIWGFKNLLRNISLFSHLFKSRENHITPLPFGENARALRQISFIHLSLCIHILLAW